MTPQKSFFRHRRRRRETFPAKPMNSKRSGMNSFSVVKKLILHPMRTAHILPVIMFAVGVCPAWAGQTAETLSPKDYSELHIVASNWKDPKWADAMHKLARVGDAFTVDYLKPLQAQNLDPAQTKILNETLSAARDRVTKEDVQAFAALIQIRLERAAWADLMCNKLEGPLVSWTMRSMRERLNSPEVVARLKVIQSHYVPSAEAKTLFGSMEQR